MLGHRHPWEVGQHSASSSGETLLGQRHRWEGRNPSDNAHENVNAGDPADTPEYAAWSLLEMLKQMLYADGISAQAFCILINFMLLADLEALRPYALGPGKQSGKYQAHLDKVSGYSGKDTRYYVDTPCTRKHDDSRGVYKVATAPAFELLRDDLAEQPELAAVVAGEVAKKDWPEAYYEHPVVSGTEDVVYPYSLYVDGLPYSGHDSAIGFFFHFENSGVRHLSCVLRKAI